MIMSAPFRKLALFAHVISSVGMLGAVAAFFALAVTGLTTSDAQTMRAVYPAMALIARVVIVPLAFASLVTGLIQSLGTSWGLFQHYWVLAKLLLTVMVTVVLLVQLELIDALAEAAAAMSLDRAELGSARVSVVVHAGGGLLVLLAPVALSLYKPRGMTRFGWRKWHAPTP